MKYEAKRFDVEVRCDIEAAGMNALPRPGDRSTMYNIFGNGQY